MELFIQGQSQQVQYLINLLHKRIGRQEIENFIYERINPELNETCHISIDEADRGRLEKLAEKATAAFQNNVGEVSGNFIEPG